MTQNARVRARAEAVQWTSVHLAGPFPGTLPTTRMQALKMFTMKYENKDEHYL